MKHNLFLILFLFSCFLVNAQGGFTKIFQLDSIATAGIDIEKAANGNFYVLSEKYVQGLSSCAISEFTETGSMLWSKNYWTNDSVMSNARIISLGHHGLLLAFESASTYATSLVILDTAGNLLHTFRNDTIFIRGGIAYSESDSSIILVGTTYTFGLTLVKLDLNGNVIWTKLIDVLTNGAFDAWDIHVTNNNQLMFFGLGGSGGHIYWATALLDSLGVPIQYWHSRDLMVPGTGFGMMVSKLLTGNRLLCVTSDLDLNTNIVDLNFFKTYSMGKPIAWAKFVQPWNKSFYITSIAVTDDAYYFGGNYSDTLLGASGLLTLDTMLNFVNYISVFDTAQVESGDAFLSTNSSGGLLMTGSCSVNGLSYAYLTRTDSNDLVGCSLPLNSWTPAAFDILDTIQVTTVDSSLTHFYYTDTVYMQWKETRFTVAEICEPTFVSENINGIEYTVYPNPATNILTLHSLNFPQEKLSYSITDLSGKEIYKENLISDETLIDISILSPGLYFISVLGSEKNEVHKFIKAAD